MTYDSAGPSTHFGHDRLMARIASSLRDANIPYMVIGGQAVVLHGEPRLTRDVDWTLCIPPYESVRLLRLLPQMGLRPLVDDPASFIAQAHILPCTQEGDPLRVDFAMTDSSYEVHAAARGVDKVLYGVPVRFASVEDLLIHKLIAARARDIDDARSVILKNPDFDRDDVRQWLARFAEVLEGSFVEQFEALLRECEQ